jgi:thioredoxin 2
MTTDTALHIVCPHCDAVNRVAPSRLSDSPRCGRCREGLFDGRPVELDAARFDRHLTRNDLPLIVDFWAPWCAPCRSMAPAYAQSATALEPRARLAKVDTEAHPDLASRFGIRSIPTLIAFRGGREIARQSGALPASALQQWIKQFC